MTNPRYRFTVKPIGPVGQVRSLYADMLYNDIWTHLRSPVATGCHRAVNCLEFHFGYQR